jgi:hypothetical protein
MVPALTEEVPDEEEEGGKGQQSRNARRPQQPAPFQRHSLLMTGRAREGAEAFMGFMGETYTFGGWASTRKLPRSSQGPRIRAKGRHPGRCRPCSSSFKANIFEAQTRRRSFVGEGP